MPFDNSPTENLGYSKETIYNNGASIIQGTPPPYIDKSYSSYPCLSTPYKRYIYWSGQNLFNWFDTDNDFTFEYYQWVTGTTTSNWYDYGLEIQQNGQWVIYNENFNWGFSTVGANGNYSYSVNIYPVDKVKPNVWNHIAVCRSGNDFYQFFNGKLISKGYSDAKFYNGSNCLIMLGSINNAPQSYYKNLRISNICRYKEDFDPVVTSGRGFFNVFYSNIKTS